MQEGRTMARAAVLVVGIFALIGISTALGPREKVPRLCLPRQVTETVVVADGVGLRRCPGPTDAGNTFTDSVERRMFRTVSLTNCSIVGSHRVDCEITGRNTPRTRLRYMVNVTCSSMSTPYGDNREALEQHGRDVRKLRAFLKQRPVVRSTFEGRTLWIRYFRGGKTHYSECAAGVYGSVRGRMDICFCPAAYREAVCSLPPETGRCRAYFPRYFYNSSSEQCERFIYGGCRGNGNNFETTAECLAACTDCPPGKSYSSCGSSCPKTCANKDEDMSCIALCREGCFCAEGFVEHEGRCVWPQQCPSVCDWEPDRGPCRARLPRWFHNSTSGECEQFFYGGCRGNPNNFKTRGDCDEACPEDPGCPGDKVPTTCGSLCPVSCDSLNDPPTCIDLCVGGCACPSGTVQLDSTSDRCVPPVKCGQEEDTGNCPAGKVFRTCGSSCPRTCQNKDESAIACTKQCVVGCFCPEGQVELGASCVRAEECPQTKCRSGKVFRECGSACPATCSSLGDTKPCTQDCTAGCFCPPGYVERGDGCVRPQDCQCPQGKEYKRCGTSCPKTCENKDKVFPCTLQCVEGCFCPDGLVEHDGRCINATKCPEEQCPEGKVYQECGTACPRTCDNKDDVVTCTFQCVEGCFCPPGYVELGDQCVLSDNCPTAPSGGRG